jgi:diacylglycerol kinase (ATP)
MLHLVVNPVAGRGRVLPHLDGLVRSLEAAGLATTVHRTERPRHATQIVMALPPGAVPVAVGGDGTVHEVAAACLHRGLAMGIVPSGSGDDFAFALGMDRFDVEAAARTLADGAVRHVDVGMVAGEAFVNAFGTGFDADVARRVEHAPAWYRGLGRYLYGIVTAMRDFALRDVRVEVDGREAYAGPSLLVGVQNGPRAGGSFLFAPSACPDDARFDVVVAGSFGRLGTLGVLPRVMRGTHLTHPRIHAVRGQQVRVRWSNPVVAHVDGEVFERPAEAFEVELRAAALAVLAPNGVR